MTARRVKYRRTLFLGLGAVAMIVYLTVYTLVKPKCHNPGMWRSTVEEEWQPRKVLLFAYARSGSSLTGDIINHSPDVYYVYEPLYTLYKGDVNVATLHTVNKLLQSLFHCDFSTPDVSKIPKSFLHRSEATKAISRCNKLPEGSLARGECMIEAEAVCRMFSSRVIKVIRYSMSPAEDLMTLLPDLALIFLVRDPRASIWSRMNVFKFPKLSELGNFSRGLCQRMKGDFEVALKMVGGDFPERIQFLRYEELADRPLQVSEKIYSFLHLNWTASVRENVLNQTSSTHADPSTNDRSTKTSLMYSGTTVNSTRTITDRTKDAATAGMLTWKPDSKHHWKKGYVYSVKRSDSSVAASVWRTDVPWRVVDVIQTSCDDLIRLLGYTPFQSEAALRNLNFSNRDKFRISAGLDLGELV